MKKITLKFNIIASFLGMFLIFINCFYQSPEKNTYVDKICEKSLPLGISLIILSIAIGIPVSMYLMKELWNRLIANIFNVREINYAESYAFMLLMGLFS